ncbi:glycosyltransferase family 4 protein [Puia sp. P3]|uniref:glycosyltransferase family 4 protein n=1 Tax=Puia sp. P3 TaxID=3423952 RepID=UPI003D66F732
MSTRKKIVVFADWYEPGYKAGGPIRSCVNFARHMQGSYDVYVFTGDRDLNTPEPYEGIPADQWIIGGGGEKVYYASPGQLGWSTIRREIRAIGPDFIYLNSMFSLKFTIFPLLISRLSGLSEKVVLSPRGMLRSSAVQFKIWKKKIFLQSFRLLGFSRSIRFLASDETEEKDVKGYFGPRTRVVQIPNFPASLPESPTVALKQPGELSMIFVGRVHPIKNPDFLLDVLGGVKAKVNLTIVGSCEDPEFWQQCEKMIRDLPANISVNYAGEMPNHQLPDIIARHHIFTLPTRGENFGHAIFEALVLGKPVLISDQTPWRGLRGKDGRMGPPAQRSGRFPQGHRGGRRIWSGGIRTVVYGDKALYGGIYLRAENKKRIFKTL